MARDLTIVQVNAQDIGGGAERVAMDLFEAYSREGLSSYLVVGRKRSDHPNVLTLSSAEGHGALYSAWRRFADKLGGPIRVFDEWRGVESFHYPATYRLPSLPPQRPDIIHAHNLHGGYFDLRALPWLSDEAPLVLTLHDAWLLSGHCSHSFDCERWQHGCGECPDLSIYPAVRRDATAYNWQRKQSIFARSSVYVATPCQWLMDRVKRSMLSEAIVDSRVIPNGVDLDTFHPADKIEARRFLGLREDVNVVMCAASGMRQNQFKDFDTVRAAISKLAPAEDAKLRLVVLGESGKAERLGSAHVEYVPFTSSASEIARYYQAADVYVHAARAETFPMTILEALACGTPVVATAVGGIPEQIKHLSTDGGSRPKGFSAAEATGILVSQGDSQTMAEALSKLLADPDLRSCLGRNAARDARSRFGLERQRDAYMSWYRSILDR